VTYGIKVSVAPGSEARLGNAESQACSISAKVLVAGNLIKGESHQQRPLTRKKDTDVAGFPDGGVAAGTTSEQSTKWRVSWPTTASLAMTFLKAADIFSCSLTNPCHVHAVLGSITYDLSD
jgi:hypothetical protein